MPLTRFQSELLAVLAKNSDPGRYLAGGAALHFALHSTRYSDDLDFFHDSEERVASAFEADRRVLEHAGYILDVTLSQPGFIRAMVRSPEGETRIDWAHDSAWRFLPLLRDELGGWMLHPIDLAINKVLALAGRDEPRDLVDTLFAHRTILSLGALVWAAVGKDPGFSPHQLLELLKRRGRPRPEELARLQLAEAFDIGAVKQEWLDALEQCASFIGARSPDELGCLYYDTMRKAFLTPEAAEPAAQGVVCHFGAPGGVVPQVAASDSGEPPS